MHQVAGRREAPSTPAGRANRARPTTVPVADAIPSSGPPWQIDQGEQHDPDDVDEMPIEAGDGDGGVIILRIRVMNCTQRDRAEYRDANRDMQGVNARRHEVDREKLKRCASLGSTDCEVETR